MNLIKCNECGKKSIVLVVFLLLAVCTPLAAQEHAASQYKRGLGYYNGFGDRGWLAIAIVIFALWKAKAAILCSFVFGGLYICSILIPGLSSAQKELINMAPYVVTILVLIVTSIKNHRENQPPAHLGLNYFREDR